MSTYSLGSPHESLKTENTRGWKINKKGPFYFPWLFSSPKYLISTSKTSHFTEWQNIIENPTEWVKKSSTSSIYNYDKIYDLSEPWFNYFKNMNDTTCF